MAIKQRQFGIGNPNIHFWYWNFVRWMLRFASSIFQLCVLVFTEEDMLRQLMASNMRAMLLTPTDTVCATKSDVISPTTDVINANTDVLNSTTDEMNITIDFISPTNDVSQPKAVTQSNGSVGYSNSNGVINSLYGVSETNCDVRKPSGGWRNVWQYSSPFVLLCSIRHPSIHLSIHLSIHVCYPNRVTMFYRLWLNIYPGSPHCPYAIAR